MSDSTSSVNRRRFLQSSAEVGAGAALSLSAASYAGIVGSNELVRVAFLGCGARAQAHIDIVKRLRATGHPVAGVAVCDVWDGLEDEYAHEYPPGRITRRRYVQGLYPSARKLGLRTTDTLRVTKDYRRLLDQSTIDAVCIATPDHWHARMTSDAAAAGKAVYCERPLARSAEEAVAVLAALQRHPVPVTVGFQGVTDPLVERVTALIRAGTLGSIVQTQAGIHRNDIRGQWRFYRLCREMTPQTIDWPMFLGIGLLEQAEPLPFDRALFAQWRCSMRFANSPFGDLFGPTLMRNLSILGLRYPTRVSATGGIYSESDGRDVPDTVSMAIDFDEGCQMQWNATLASSFPADDVIRGRLGAVRFVERGVEVFAEDPKLGRGFPSRSERLPTPERIEMERPGNETEVLWLDFLRAVRGPSRRTLCPPESAAAASVCLALAADSYRLGRVIGWDKERRLAGPLPPSRSPKASLRPAHDLHPPEWQSLAGPWLDERDPASPTKE